VEVCETWLRRRIGHHRHSDKTVAAEEVRRAPGRLCQKANGVLSP